MRNNIIQTWINQNYEAIKYSTRGIIVKEPDDVFQEVIIQFLEMNTGKTIKLIENNEADKYIMAMYKVNCFSKTSPYQRTYNRYKRVDFDETKYKESHEKTDEKTDEMCIKDFETMLEQVDMFFVHKEVYKDYIYRKIKKSGFSINKISVESQIPKPTLDTKFKKIRTELNKIKRHDEERRND